jgi:hypothetical protein
VRLRPRLRQRGGGGLCDSLCLDSLLRLSAFTSANMLLHGICRGRLCPQAHMLLTAEAAAVEPVPATTWAL